MGTGEQVIFELPCASVSKWDLVQNLTLKMSLICMKNNLHVEETHFHMDGFAQRLVWTQRQEATLKWPIVKAASQ